MKSMHATTHSGTTRSEVRRAKQRRSSLSRKTYEELSQQERDRLLKAIAVRLGLVKDSDDA